MLKKKIFLLPGLLLLVFSLLLPLAAWAGGSGAEAGITAEWEQFQKDSFNSGLTASPAPTTGITVGWRRQVDHATKMAAGVNHTPLVAEGKVFVLGALGKTWALDAKTGKQIWKTELSSTGHEFQLATPAYADGKLFVATNDGHFYALNASNGMILWNRVIAGKYDQLYTPVKYAGGKVYVGSWLNKTYYCLNASNGEIIWQRKSTTGGGYYWSGACVVGNYLIFGDQEAVLTSVDKDTGALVDEINLKEIDKNANKIHSSVSYNPATERVYLTEEGGHCWAFDFDSRTGRLVYRWHQKIGRISTSTPVVYKGRVYVGTGTYVVKGALYCLEEETGKEIWKFTPSGAGEYSVPGVQASPSLSIQNGKVYIYFMTNYENGTAYCLDENGNKLWEFTSDEAGTPAGYGTSSVAIADGWVYFGNDGGWVYALTSPKKVQPTTTEDKKPQTPPAEKLSFTDLPADHWAKGVIEEMTAKGILKGYPGGACKPDKVVTRAEFTTLLLRALGLPDVEGAAVNFCDVQPGDWHRRAIATAYHYGLVKGYAAAGKEERGPDGQAGRKQCFRPGDPVTREQAAVMLIRALAFKGTGSADLNKGKVDEILSRFRDVSEISSWAKEAVAIAVARGIVRGCPGDLFKPRAEATRAQCAAMLTRLFK